MIDWTVSEKYGTRVAKSTTRPFGKSVLVLESPPLVVLGDMDRLESEMYSYVNGQMVLQGEWPFPVGEQHKVMAEVKKRISDGKENVIAIAQDLCDRFRSAREERRRLQKKRSEEEGDA